MPSAVTAIRGTALTFDDNPFHVGGEASARVETDALIVMQDGRIRAFGAYDEIRHELPPDTAVITYKYVLILPLFIDTHVHYPQIQMIG